MHKRRVEELCTEVYRQVFEMLDAEPELKGYECGQIAHLTEAAFREACIKGEEHIWANWGSPSFG